MRSAETYSTIKTRSESRYSKSWVVALLALFCCLLWGSAFPGIKIGYELFHIEGPGSQMLFAGYRFLFAGIMTFILFSITEKKLQIPKRSSVPVIIGQGILQTTIQYIFFYIGLANTTGTKGSVITASNAFFTIIFAHFMLKNERITLRKAIGCIIGFAGVIIVNFSPGAYGGGFSLKGDGMVIGCAIAYGASSVTLKMISDRESPATITAWQLISGSIVLIIAGTLAGGRITGFTPVSCLLLFYLSILSTVAFTIWAILLKYNPAGKVAIFGFSIPVYGSALSAIFLGESIFTFSNLLALILVSGGIITVNYSRHNDV